MQMKYLIGFLLLGLIAPAYADDATSITTAHYTTCMQDCEPELLYVGRRDRQDKHHDNHHDGYRDNHHRYNDVSPREQRRKKRYNDTNDWRSRHRRERYDRYDRYYYDQQYLYP